MKTNIINTRGLFTAMTLLAAAATACAETIISGGAVTGTWNAAGSPYLVQGNITVPDGQTLTISEGVQIRFATNVSLTVDGILSAVGTSTNPVVFTSDRSTPAPGDWVGIVVSEGTVTLRNCIAEYAKDGIYAEAFAYVNHMSVSVVTVENSALRFCSRYGISLVSYGASGGSYKSATIYLTCQFNNICSNGTSGIRCYA